MQFRVTELMQENSDLVGHLERVEKDAERMRSECVELRAEADAVVISRALHI